MTKRKIVIVSTISIISSFSLGHSHSIYTIWILFVTTFNISTGPHGLGRTKARIFQFPLMVFTDVPPFFPNSVLNRLLHAGPCCHRRGRIWNGRKSLWFTRIWIQCCLFTWGLFNPSSRLSLFCTANIQRDLEVMLQSIDTKQSGSSFLFSCFVSSNLDRTQILLVKQIASFFSWCQSLLQRPFVFCGLQYFSTSLTVYSLSPSDIPLHVSLLF